MHHDESCTRANSLFHYASTGKFDQLRRIVVRRWLHYLATTESSVTQTRFRTSQLFPLSNATTLNIEYLLCRRGNEAIAITNISTRFSNSIFSPFREVYESTISRRKFIFVVYFNFPTVPSFLLSLSEIIKAGEGW